LAYFDDTDYQTLELSKIQHLGVPMSF